MLCRWHLLHSCAGWLQHTKVDLLSPMYRNWLPSNLSLGLNAGGSQLFLANSGSSASQLHAALCSPVAVIPPMVPVAMADSLLGSWLLGLSKLAISFWRADECTHWTPLQAVASLFCVLNSGIPVYVAVDARLAVVHHPLLCWRGQCSPRCML